MCCVRCLFCVVGLFGGVICVMVVSLMVLCKSVFLGLVVFGV